MGGGFMSCSDLVQSLSEGNGINVAEVHDCLKVRDNLNLVPAGSRATGVNMKDTSNDEKMDISKEEHSEISAEAEEKTDTAQEDDGVGANCKEGKGMGISDEDFEKFASLLQMDMPKLKEWFVKSKYKAEEFRGFFELRFGEHPLHIAAEEGEVEMVEMLINEAKVDVNIQVCTSLCGYTVKSL